MLRNLRSVSGVSSAAAKKSTSAYFFSSTTSKGLKVVVAGAAGGIGQPLSMLLKIDLPKGSTLSLYDVANTPGVAADLSHINTSVKVEAHLGDMKDVNNVTARDAALKGADLVLIPAGVPRKPGMTRDDLFKTNAGIVKSLVEGIAKQCPGAFIGIITNPVNSTVPIAAEVLKKHNVYDPKKLFGVSYLDVVRAQTFVAETKGLDAAATPVEVIGGHSPETMIPILSKVSGATFTDAEAKTLSENVKHAGTAVVNAKGGAGSATLSMAFAAAKFAEAAVAALQGKNTKTIAFVDTKSLKATAPANYFGLTVEIGKEGVTKVHPLPKLNAYEEEQLKVAVPALEANIKTGETFAKSS